MRHRGLFPASYIEKGYKKYNKIYIERILVGIQK